MQLGTQWEVPDLNSDYVIPKIHYLSRNQDQKNFKNDEEAVNANNLFI